MKNIPLQRWLEMFNLEILEKIFETFSQLEKGSYGIFRKQYADGSGIYMFEYPTDFDEQQAQDLVERINSEIKSMSVNDLHYLIHNT